MKDILTLGIESSCDETAAAVVLNGRTVLSNVISTSLDLHKTYGGVVPEIASRKHVEFVMPAIDEALNKAGVKASDIDYVGVTYGPGLIGALLVGLSAAKSLAWAWNKPLVPVHHIEGHISANFLQYADLEPPFVCLVASGGHSHIVNVKDYGVFEILGRTRDDAAGEAYDKISRALGLGYPGGPVVDKMAADGNPDAIQFPRVHFKDSYDFSFSGVKTAVLNYLNKANMQGEEISIPDVCASFQSAVIDVLSENAFKAVKELGYNKIALAGGVASNRQLRETMEKEADKRGISFYRPAPILCTDNGAMIAAAAYYAAEKKQRFAGLDLNAFANVSIEEI
ncbi:MAG: tRNA (adenosine(37)-N6)-threonylcarbamoyltransferase complex transferase subunit TsaD [Ruminococcaceae bacterium]|nr:tRNA (adenosine(37)-N6)-threonylcarbamoyltransferase complex transferase subunit TsaD [Oscillospiraceae bacterium]